MTEEEQPTITQADYTWADWQLAEQCVSAANVVTCDGYYEVDIEKVAETLAKARTTSLAAQVDALRQTRDALRKLQPALNVMAREIIDDIIADNIEKALP